MAVRSAYWSLVRWAAVVGMGCGCGGSAVSDTPRARSPHRAAWLRAGGVPCGLRRLCLIRLSLRGGVGAEAGDNGDGESKRGVRYPRTAEASADEARRNGDNGENAGWDDGARYFHVLTGSATAKDDADVELMDDTRSTVWEPAVFSYVAGCGERRSTRGGGEGLGGDADVQLEREGEAHADAEEEIVERAQDTAAAAATGGEDQETVHLEAGQEQEEKGAAAMAQMWGRSKSNPILGQRYIPRAPTNVCWCACTCSHTHTHTRTHTYIILCTRTCAYIHTRTYVLWAGRRVGRTAAMRMKSSASIHTHMYIHTHTHTHYTHTHTHTVGGLGVLSR